MSISHVVKKAEDLALKYSEAPAVDVKKIAAKLGLRVYESDLENDVSGILVRRENISFCFYNSKDAHTRQRFTIAHEMAHFVLGHQDQQGEDVHVDKGNFMLFRDQRSRTGLVPIEREANAFAAALLMPSKLINAELKNYGLPLSDIDVTNLAKTFDVSEQAMVIRLLKLGLV